MKAFEVRLAKIVSASSGHTDGLNRSGRTKKDIRSAADRIFSESNILPNTLFFPNEDATSRPPPLPPDNASSTKVHNRFYDYVHHRYCEHLWGTLDAVEMHEDSLFG